MKTLALALLLGGAAALGGACRSANAPASPAPAAAAPIRDAFATEPRAGANYGDGVAADARVAPFAELLAEVDAAGSATGVVAGTVVEVCQMKGCWMTLEPEGADGREVSVRFKDYGFFMPKTLSGSRVVVEGTAARTEVSVADLRHYAEDAGKSPAEVAAITEPEVTVEFTATGVRVL